MCEMDLVFIGIGVVEQKAFRGKKHLIKEATNVFWDDLLDEFFDNCEANMSC